MKTPTHKGLACLLALTLALCAAFFTSGCASTGERSITKQDVITAAEIAAGIVIDNDARVAEALKVVRDARQIIENGQTTTVSALAEYIVTRALQSQDLSPGQVSALKSFIRRYTDTITLELDQIGLDPQVLVTASEILDAVERVALEIRKYGAPLQRSYSTERAMAPEPIDESLGGWITDKRTRERYPLFGPAPQKVDPKWHEGLRWMLANPQPLPEGI
jgi:hypothetical protein